MKISPGTIIVPKRIVNKTFLSLKLSRANAKAESVVDIIANDVVRKPTKIVLKNTRPKLTAPIAGLTGSPASL